MVRTGDQIAPVGRLSKSRRAGCCSGVLVDVKCDRDIRMIIFGTSPGATSPQKPKQSRPAPPSRRHDKTR